MVAIKEICEVSMLIEAQTSGPECTHKEDGSETKYDCRFPLPNGYCSKYEDNCIQKCEALGL